jgi:hypothetical protein
VLVYFASTLAAGATSYPVAYAYLNASATVGSTLEDGDSLLVDTLVTTEIGELLQITTFTVGSSVDSVHGVAAWQVSDPNGPRIVDVDIEIRDAADNLIVSDTFSGLLSEFAHSTLDAALAPGTYRLIVTGTAERESVVDVSLTFAPEPGTAFLLLSGLAFTAVAARSRRTTA